MIEAIWAYFIGLRDHVDRHPELVDRFRATYLFRLHYPAALWTVDLKNSRGAVLEGGAGADHELETDGRAFLAMVANETEAPPHLAFLREVDPELARAAVERARAAGQGPGITPSEVVVVPPRRPRP